MSTSVQITTIICLTVVAIVGISMISNNKKPRQ